MLVELHFVRKICHPTKEQMRPIKEELERYVKERSGDFVNMRRVRVRLEQRRRVPQVAGSISDTNSLIQDKLTALVESHLSHEQASRYRSEVEKRSADRRRICVLNLVAILDRELCLTAKQRERLSSVLSTNWDGT